MAQIVMKTYLKTVLAALTASLFLATSASAVDVILPSTGGSGTPNDLYDLDHYNYYFWGVKYTLPANSEITSAFIKFINLDDWQVESDRLYVDLFDSATDAGVGTRFGSAKWTPFLTAFNNISGPEGSAVAVKGDNQETTDALRNLGGYRLGNEGSSTGNGKFIFKHNTSTYKPYPGYGINDTGYWTDTDNPANQGRDLVIEIPSSLFSWIADGNFGIGIDPDCHYWNDKILIEINTVGKTPPPPTPDGGATVALLGLAFLGIERLRRKFSK